MAKSILEEAAVSKVQQKQIKRRAEILEKVIELLKLKSFEDISVQDICDASGISVGSFYHYFKQKSDLLIGLMGLIDFYMADHVFPRLTHKDAYENLRELSRGFATFVNESGIEISKLISRVCPTDYGLDNEKRLMYKKLIEIVSQGQESGEFNAPMNPEKISDLLLIAMSGVAVDWSRRDGSYSISERMDEFTALFFPALLCPSVSDSSNQQQKQSIPVYPLARNPYI